MQERPTQNLANEGWFAEAVKQATGERGDLRMVLELEKIVRTPYFRSYWVQQNITEMKQYASAVSDLYRSSQAIAKSEFCCAAPERLPSRKATCVLSPLWRRKTRPFMRRRPRPPRKVCCKLCAIICWRSSPERAAASYSTAPSAAAAENAGSAAQLDVRIDQAPVAANQADAFAPLRALLAAQPPDASLEVFSTRAPRESAFVSLQTAMALSAPRDWDESAVRQALTSALPSGLTAGSLGVKWEKRSSTAGEYLALDGALPLYLAVNGKQLLLANDSLLLESLLARSQKAVSSDANGSVTYAALFQHTQEESSFRRLMAQLDLAGQRGASDRQTPAASGETPAFFSGDVASLSRVFSNVKSERIEEKDLGAKVTQTVTYQWNR